ncbi:MAG: hypothetical protein IJ955_06965 [Oscillospiraceae bacterium]|nr:hypothetical protein [Oscillospiraceae bacterium]
MATKLTTKKIDNIETTMIDGVDLWEEDAEHAKMTCVYIAGIHDMANAIRKVIKELEGK